LQLKNGDILVEKSGGGENTPVGRTVIFHQTYCALYANFIDRLRVRQEFSPNYVEYVLVSLYYNKLTMQFVKQTTGIQNLDIHMMFNMMYFPLFPYSEQQRIAAYLDAQCAKIDTLISKEQAVIEKLKEYKQALITRAVTKGLDTDVPMKDSGVDWVGEIPTDWRIIKLKYISYIRARLGWRGLKANEYVDMGYIFLSAFNIVNNRLDFSDVNYID